MDQMDYLHFNYLKGVFTSLLEFTSSRCEQVENSHSILNDFALAQLRFAIQTINKRYGNLNTKSMTSLRRTIVQLKPDCGVDKSTIPLQLKSRTDKHELSFPFERRIPSIRTSQPTSEELASCTT